MLLSTVFCIKIDKNCDFTFVVQENRNRDGQYFLFAVYLSNLNLGFMDSIVKFARIVYSEGFFHRQYDWASR